MSRRREDRARRGAEGHFSNAILAIGWRRASLPPTKPADALLAEARQTMTTNVRPRSGWRPPFDGFEVIEDDLPGGIKHSALDVD